MEANEPGFILLIVKILIAKISYPFIQAVCAAWMNAYHVSFGNGNWIVDAWSVTIPGLIVMLYVSKHWFQNSRFLLFVGANTLFYFAFHGKVYSLLQTICHKAIASDLLASDGAQFAIAVCIVALDALILILPAMFVNKYCPFLLGKGFKLWKT